MLLGFYLLGVKKNSVDFSMNYTFYKYKIAKTIFYFRIVNTTLSKKKQEYCNKIIQLSKAR
jgi:hypothetical protein